jgi:LPS-assembly lipoprotein
MHLSHQLAAIVLSLGLTASLSGCGFHLRGTQTAALPQDYQSIALAIPEQAQDLKKPLEIALTNIGSQVNSADAQRVLRINGYHLKRFLFSGTLTEVQLHLSVSFSIEDRAGNALTAPRTVFAQRSYQYDRASVNVDNQEQDHLIQVMQNDISQQIARQLHANRLPHAQTDQAQ